MTQVLDRKIIDNVKPSKTGLNQDNALRDRHRTYGWDCPACDLDYVVIEFDRKVPCALIDFKHQNWNRKLTASTDVLKNLADMAGIYFFIVQYSEDFTRWKIIPINEKAKEKINNKNLTVSERKYVDFLYWLRNRETPDNIRKTFEEVL